MKRLVYSIICQILILLMAIVVQGQTDIYHIKYESVDNGSANPPTYNDPTEFEIAHITSDYGRRNHPGATQWHRGVDFNLNNQEAEDHILSLNDATVEKIHVRPGYKVIITSGDDHFGYGHIFINGIPPNSGMERGDMVLKKMVGFNSGYAIINITTMTAMGRTAGITNPVVEYLEGSGIFIPVTDQVDADQPIAIMGNSGTNNVHLHLYMFYDIWLAIQDIGNDGGGYSNITNDRDPMQLIAHPNISYDVSIETNSLTINGQHFIENDKVVSPGDQSISLKVRYNMMGATPSGSQFTNAVMDIDNVGLYVKQDFLQTGNSQNWGNSGSSCQLILGEFAASFLSHGARMNSEIQPIKANSTYGFPSNPEYNTEINIANNVYGNNGSTTTTGIDPYAYRDGNNQPYDDYYFSDFYTRVIDTYQPGGTHDFAAANCEAKYKDGKYQLFAKVTTIRGDEYTSVVENEDPTEIIIDNFRPYIKKVIITQRWYIESNPVYVTVYNSEWNCVEGSPGSLVQSFIENKAFKASSLTYLEITSSEALEYCNLSLPPLSIPISQTEVNDAHTVWKYNISDVNLPPPGFYTLNIVGKDLADNYLQSNPTTIPIRQSNKENGEWYPEPCPGTDENHSFEISSCMLAFSFTPEIISFGEETTVNITNLTSGYDEDNFTWHWTFGNATTVPFDFIGKNPTPIIYQNNNLPGEYKIQIQILSDGYLVDYLKKYIQIIDPETYILTDFSAAAISENGELYGNSPLTVQFADLTSGNPDAWNWDFGDIIGTSIEQNPEYTFTNSGYFPEQYTVTLEACNTTSNCSAEMKNAYITVYPDNAALDPIANFNITQSSLFAPCTVYLNNNSTGEIDSYEWDLDGDGIFDDSNNENPESPSFNESQSISLSL